MKTPKIVILGAGYGGILTVQNLQKNLRPEEAEVILVNKNDYHYFTTELHQPAAGTFPIEKTKVLINEIIDTSKVKFIQDTVVEIKTDEQKVVLENGELEYDQLVIGLGAEPETFGIQGLKEYAFSKWTIDAVRELHSHIESKFENYQKEKKEEDLTFVVGGAGFTGIEFMGELTEAVVNLSKKYNVDRSLVQLITVEAAPTVLPGFDPTLVEHATNYLKSKGVEFIIGTGIKECLPNGVILADDRVIHAGTVVWAAGVRGSSLIEQSGLEHMRGRVKVDEFLRAPGFENVYVIGDCSLVINEEQNRPYPPTAQIAMQMGKNLAGNILATLRGVPNQREKFVPNIRGTVASLGRHDAVGVVGGLKIKGAAAVAMKKVIDLRYLFIIGGIDLVLKKGRF